MATHRWGENKDGTSAVLSRGVSQPRVVDTGMSTIAIKAIWLSCAVNLLCSKRLHM